MVICPGVRSIVVYRGHNIIFRLLPLRSILEKDIFHAPLFERFFVLYFHVFVFHHAYTSRRNAYAYYMLIRKVYEPGTFVVNGNNEEAVEHLVKNVLQTEYSSI